MWLEVSVNNSSGVTEVDSVDQLEHEQLDLVRVDGLAVHLEIFFQVIISKLKNKVELLLIWTVNDVHEAV